MTNPALELARQRAQAEGAAGVTITPISQPGYPRPSSTDWGALRGPNDPNGDGGISTVSLPPLITGEQQRDFDDGGFGAQTHPATEPFKKLLSRPKSDLTPDEQALLYDHLVERERLRQEQRDALALETEKFEIEKKRTLFGLVKKFAIGFGIMAATSFTALIALLVWVSIKKMDFTDTSVLTSILNTFSTFFQILANM